MIAAIAALGLAVAIPAIAGAGHQGAANPKGSAKPGVGVPGGLPAPGAGSGGVSSGGGGTVGVGVSPRSTGSGGASTGIAYPSRPIAAPPAGVVPAVCPAAADLPGCRFPYPGPIADHTVTVSGSAVVSSQPDEAVVGLGVQTQASDATDALRENANRMTAVIDALKSLGIDDKDIATSSVSLNPVYDSNGSQVTGYQADNEISVTLHDLSKAGPAIDAATAAGANLATGISFQLSQGSPELTGALAAAVKDARSKAEAIATAAGATLGDVISIQEDSASAPIPYAEAAAGVAAPTPVQPPTIQTSVSVTVVWALAPAAA